MRPCIETEFKSTPQALRSNLRPYLPEILANLTPHLQRVATTPLMDPSGAASTAAVPSLGAAAGVGTNKSQPGVPGGGLVDDRLYVFEAVGLLLGQEDLAAGQQEAALSSMLQPLLQQVRRDALVSVHLVPFSAFSVFISHRRCYWARRCSSRCAPYRGLLRHTVPLMFAPYRKIAMKRLCC